jgi:chromosome segregation ATPase
MDPSLIIAIGAFICVPLLGYFTIVRQASGKIGTSEAEQLWEESRSIREWATSRIAELNGVVEKLEKKVALLEEHNESLSLENGRLSTLLDEQAKTMAELREQIHRLSNINIKLVQDNDKLQEQNDILRARIEELETTYE